jgi:hypothetical protein
VAREIPVWGAYLATLAGAPVLPTRFEPLARNISEALRGLPSGSGDSIGLASVDALAGQFVERARRLDTFADGLAARFAGTSTLALEDAAAEVNQAFLHLSRLLTAPMRSVAGRYGQDSYGLSDLTAPIPALLPAARLAALPVSSEEARLLRTELRRRRNALADGLSDAVWTIERTLAHVQQ